MDIIVWTHIQFTEYHGVGGCFKYAEYHEVGGCIQLTEYQGVCGCIYTLNTMMYVDVLIH